MEYVRLGKSNLMVSKSSFGCLPIQRITTEEAIYLLHKAFDNGINFYDTAHYYTDSEVKIGLAFHDVREKVIIATKTMELSVEGFWKDLNTSLQQLQTSYIDLYQFHNAPFCPRPGDGSGLYEAMLEAKEQGIIRHIGLTTHRTEVAEEAIRSGLYETLQFPFSYFATEQEEAVARLCHEYDVGFICMKAMAGGLIRRSDVAYAYLSQFHAVPIWGIQKESELDEFLACCDNPPPLNEERLAYIQKEREEFGGEFCRGCGYCMPTCPAKIEINNCARMALLLRRSDPAVYLTDSYKAKMKQIENCIDCGICKTKCPYNLDTPTLLKKHYEVYKTYL